jgi:D-alanine-D-alanine ligase
MRNQHYCKFDVGDIKYFANHEDLKNDILLICHLDVPYPSRDFTRFREERGKISGTGITESKGGLATLLSALQSLRFTRRLRKIKCGILLTTDYTLGGDYSKNLIEEYSKHSGCVVSLKWCDLDGGVITSCYGRDEFNVELSNTKDSINPTISDLIPAVSKKIIALNKLSKKDSIVKVTSMEARTSYGQAPDYASFSVINNFQSNTIANDLEKQLRQILKKQESMKLDIEISKGFRREALVESKVSLEFLESIKKIADSIDVKIHGSNRLISSDISYVADGVPAIDGLGPLGGSYRSPNEYILRDSLIDRALLLALIISNSATIDKK